VFLDAHKYWRHVKVTDQRTARDFAACMRDLADVHNPDTDQIRVVLEASFAKLEATTEGLTAAMAESERLMNESKAILASYAPPEPMITSDVVDGWLSRLAP
jgi:hypothetical protein